MWSTAQVKLVGHVLDASTGAGVANAHVVLSGENAVAVTANTGATGAFELALEPGKQYTVSEAAAEDYEPYSREWSSSAITIATGSDARTQDVTLYLKPMVEYTGVVQDMHEARVAGASIRLVDLRPTEHAVDSLADELTSDGRGEFKFYAPENALLEAWHRAHGSGRARIDATVAFTRRLVIRLDQAADATLSTAGITGRVVAANGTPIPSAAVRAVHVETYEMHPRAQVLAGADGQFEIEGLDAGMHVVWVVCEGCASTRSRVMTGTDVTLTVGRGSELAGRVVDANNGAPVQMFSVQLLRRRGTHHVVLEEVTVVHPDGRFELRGVPDGDFFVRAAARGHAISDLVSVSVAETDFKRAEVLVRLERGAAIEGVVLDRSSNAPIERALVAVEGSSEFRSAALAIGVSTITDSAGRFAITGVSPGLRSVRAGTAGYHMAMVSGLEANAGTTIGPLEIKLTKTGMNEQPQVDLSGIGARLESDEGVLVVADIVKHGGASIAGLRVGDVIVKVDGELVTALGVRAAIERTRGPPGSSVLLTLRGPDETLKDIRVLRRPFRY